MAEFEILVVGGGPAGMAAAASAAESGLRVGIVDENPALGGQIWRQSLNSPSAEWPASLTAPMKLVTAICGYRVFDHQADGILHCEGNSGVVELRYDKLILATGARERFLPFPGWTLPNVMGAGGLQAMVKSGLPVQGKRVVVAGTGPLLLAVASYLRKSGAHVLLICEQASRGALVRFALELLEHREKLGQARQVRKELAGIPFASNAWPVEAHGGQKLESVTISRRGRLETIACDYLACGFHLVPNIELPLLLGCEIENGCVRVDDSQRTTVKDVFCAGEPTGIGGLEQALIEGQIAGLAASGREPGRAAFAARTKARRFARLLDRAFQLRPELKKLPQSDTVICRCEDVSYSRLREHISWKSAKLQARCGMGPCQGRICGPATEFLFGWKMESVRPPIFPARLDSISSLESRSVDAQQQRTGGIR